MGSPSNHVTRRVLVAMFIASALLAVGVANAAGAGASPANAKTALHGTFQCANNMSGTFVVNNGNNHAHQTAWSAAHLTFNGGGTGVFTPTSINLTITQNGQVVGTEHFTKHTKPGQVSCTIDATPGPGFELSGTVIGTIVATH